MTKAELKQRVAAFKEAQAAREEKAADMEVIANAMSKLPYGQLKKLLTDEVVAVLEKYGVTE